MPIFRKMNYPRGEANTLKNLGGIYTRLGDRQNAMDCYNEALALAAFVADPILESQTLIPVSYTHLDVYKRQGLHCRFHKVDAKFE